MSGESWRSLLVIHLAIFIPITAVMAAFAGSAALVGGSLAFLVVFGTNAIVKLLLF